MRLRARGLPCAQQQLVEIDRGELNITSKRLLSDGNGKNTAILHSKVLKFTAMLDGVMVDKEAGKDPFSRSERTLPHS